ncbi:MAG: flavodoxin family protein [Lachnospiraceae bacterium]|nr:flavodoxin family protein [Lachnospiraceae bacterium]
MGRCKVLIMLGSPRKDGNSTTLARAFAKGAESAGHIVQFFDAARAEISGCHGDNSCVERGSCGIPDDGQKMAELMEWADVLVLATPLYFGSYSSQLKRAIDRFHVFVTPKGKEKLKIKKCYIIATGKAKDADMFDGLELEFEHLNKALGSHPGGRLLIGELSGAEDAAGKDYLLKRASDLGYKVGW